MSLKPVTPLRRSERHRRPTAKAIGSSPDSSPGTAAYVRVGRSINPRSRIFSARDRQTDSDSTLRNTSTSQSSGSSTEGTVGDATDSTMGLAVSLPSNLHEVYQGLAPILRYSDAGLMKLDISVLNAYLKEINPFLLKVIKVGYSSIWPEFETFSRLCNRIYNIIMVKIAALPPKMRNHEEIFVGLGNGLDFEVGPGSVTMKGEHWREDWRDTADTGYIRSLYENAAAPSDLSWDDIGAGGSEVQSMVTDVLDYSLSYPPARTLDYCTIPDTYY